MIDIVNRLRFDAIRCEAQFSKGVAGNITEAADEIDALRAALSWIENLDPPLGEAAREKFLDKRLESNGAGQPQP